MANIAKTGMISMKINSSSGATKRSFMQFSNWTVVICLHWVLPIFEIRNAKLFLINTRYGTIICRFVISNSKPITGNIHLETKYCKNSASDLQSELKVLVWWLFLSFYPICCSAGEKETQTLQFSQQNACGYK